MSVSSVSVPLYNRLTRYLNYLKQLTADEPVNISATAIATALALNDVVVRKDIASVSDGGKSKIGYVRAELIADLEHFLGHDNQSDAALVGVGNLGKALLSYDNFENYGLKIVAAFDRNPDLIGQSVNGKAVVDSAKIANLCRRLNIHIGIITVPNAFAQEVCDALVKGGVRAVWNFAPTNLKVPENVAVKNEDMAASLAILTAQLADSLTKYGVNEEEDY
ncbi:MAG: redox-sensing transcriptional repressor Rex [Oscillospiraceae bacterium]|jgi:redox-sensing transcriptional repressor|nr:redox-sensing transcriptional repressor Rex [Oscillospiraceae bacterium]